MTQTPTFDVVIPTVGRPSLARLLEALEAQTVPVPGRILLVDDRRSKATPLPCADRGSGSRVEVLEGPARGPAAARNVGWRAATAGWVAFLDDDVEAPASWVAALLSDLRDLEDDVAASQGQIHVPMPGDRAPSDWERNVGGLADARWATADMAYRRHVLEEVGGFDERFPRAYREDADLGLRVVAAGYRIVRGARTITHPIRPADRWVSLRLQAGNADDALMRALHGRGWRRAAGVPSGRRPAHAAVVASGVVAGAALLLSRRILALIAGAAWLAGTAELAWARIGPGPRTASEIATMLVTSVALPWIAVVHWLRGFARARRIRDERRIGALAESVEA